MSDVAVPTSVLIVPSPQLTVMPVTATLLVTVKVTVTISPVLAGFGVGALTVTVGTPIALTVMDVVPCPVFALLSVAVTVIVNDPAEV